MQLALQVFNHSQFNSKWAKALMGLALAPSLLLPLSTPVQAQTSAYRCHSNFKQIIQSGARSVSVFENSSNVNSRVIGEITGDEIVLVTLIDRSGRFSEIETSKKLKGWIYSNKLHPEPGEVKQFNGFLQVRSMSTRINLRSEASLRAKVISKLTTGDVVRYGRRDGQWTYVTNSTGQSGYVANPYLVCTKKRFKLLSGPDRN